MAQADRRKQKAVMAAAFDASWPWLPGRRWTLSLRFGLGGGLRRLIPVGARHRHQAPWALAMST